MELRKHWGKPNPRIESRVSELDFLGVDSQRKAWGQAFPGLAKATVDCALKEIGAVEKIVQKSTGERMQPWGKSCSLSFQNSRVWIPLKKA